MAQDNAVQGDFDNYDDCSNCDDGWDKKRSRRGGRLICSKCGGLGLVKKR